MTLAVAEVLSPNKPNLDMTLAVAESLNTNKTKSIAQRQMYRCWTIFL